MRQSTRWSIRDPIALSIQEVTSPNTVEVQKQARRHYLSTVRNPSPYGLTVATDTEFNSQAWGRLAALRCLLLSTDLALYNGHRVLNLLTVANAPLVY